MLFFFGYSGESNNEHKYEKTNLFHVIYFCKGTYKR
jgi:hypothetical protein